MRTESASSSSQIEPTTTDSPGGAAFLTSIRPCLASGKIEDALLAVRDRWSCAQILPLLKEKSADVRKLAALALSLAGDKTAVPPLAILLHDGDAMVAQVAEHALWSIWFRIGKPQAVQLAKCGNTHLHHGNYVCAIEKFSRAIQEDPEFAEAYNQRAIAYYLSERFAEAIEDCRRTLVRVPQHFGAMSGMGHSQAHLGHWRDAKQSYRLALAIHPRLEGIQLSLQQIDQLLQEHPAL